MTEEKVISLNSRSEKNELKKNYETAKKILRYLKNKNTADFIEYSETGCRPIEDFVHSNGCRNCDSSPAFEDAATVRMLVKPDTPKEEVLRILKGIAYQIETEPDLLEMKTYDENLGDDQWRLKIK